MNRSNQHVDTVWLGRVPYRQAWDHQRELVEAVQARERPDTLLLLEHPHVFTMGKRAAPEHVLWDETERARRHVDLVPTDRGGDVTYHGPGQLVGYPILDLHHYGDDVLRYLRLLEESLIRYLGTLGLEAGRSDGLTGVWVAGAKVAAIGVKLTRRVVSHGFALNLTTDLDYFGGIVPCGIEDKPVTSVERLLGAAPAVETAARDYAEAFAGVFGVQLRELVSTT